MKGRRSVPVPKEPARSKVTRVPLRARGLRTIAPTSELWGRWKLGDLRRGESGFTGEIIRLQPPARATDEDVEGLAGWLKKHGAAVVRQDERAQADVEPLADAPKTRVSIRDRVMKMAAQEDPDVQEILDKALTKAGL